MDVPVCYFVLGENLVLASSNSVFVDENAILDLINSQSLLCIGLL